MKKPDPPESNATMQIDAVGDLEGVQLDDNEAEDAAQSMPPPSVGRALPPPLPELGALSQPPLIIRPSAPPPAPAPKKAIVYGAIAVMVVVGITGGLTLGSALRGKPVAAAPSAAPSAVPSADPAPSTAPTVMRLDTIEVRDPPAETK